MVARVEQWTQRGQIYFGALSLVKINLSPFTAVPFYCFTVFTAFLRRAITPMHNETRPLAQPLIILTHRR